MLRDGPLDIAMTDVPDGFPVHRTMSETAGGFAYTDMCIVDDDGDRSRDGSVGELLVRGIGVMAGYNKRERAETFDEDGWYHTGDRVYRRDGDPRLFYVGRTSELIKSAGANVSPLEVEAVIEQFADVAQCVVVGIDDPVRGEQVCAVVVPAAAQIDVPSLAARTRDQLSSYKVPTRWVMATSEQIPTLRERQTQSEGTARARHGRNADPRLGDDATQVRRHVVGAHRRHLNARIRDLQHLPVTDEEGDTVIALRPVEDQVSRECLRRCDLLADLVLRTRGTRQLDADSREGIDHEAGRVEPDDINGRVQSHDRALRTHSDRVGGRTAATGRARGVATAV